LQPRLATPPPPPPPRSQVRPPPRIETAEERRHFASLEAAMLAFEAKMGIGSGALTGRARRG
jgi:hypothetical protein